MKVKAKIIKCSDGMMWYSDKIGDIITIERETVSHYWAREPAGYINIVIKEDVELIDERKDDAC